MSPTRLIVFRASLFLLISAAVLEALPPTAEAAKKALFDNFHAETAGNADWIIDTHQPVPSPDASGIGPNTAGTFWVGANSSWGVDLVKRGYTVATNVSALTYGNAGNPYDLSNYDVLIVNEPNILFSASEASAILAYVHDGGGLVAISDHSGSDRNNDGSDSPVIWNALDPTHLLGVHFGVSTDANNNIVQTSTNVNPSPSDSVTHGAIGVVTGLAFHNGTTLTLFPAANPTIRGEVWMTGLAQSSTTGVMAASCVYGGGRVVFVCDSSPADDGTASPGNSSIFDGWGESGATDSTLFLNATLWVSRRAAAVDATPPVVTVTSPVGGEVWKAGSSHTIAWTASDDVGVTTVDLAYSTDGGASFPNLIASGPNSGGFSWSVPNTPGTTVRVRVTAHDAAGNLGADSSAADLTIDTWTIQASAGANGSVVPSGTLPVVQGASPRFSIAPAAGCAVATLTVDGSDVTPDTAYTFANVAANHTLAAIFSDVTAPSVAVTSPVGGERWTGGSGQTITWSASDNLAVDSVNVDCSFSGAGGPWIAVAHGLGNSGALPWTVPGTPTDSALVRVTAYDHALNAASATSDSLFHIVGSTTGAAGGGPAVLALSRPQPNPGSGATLFRFSLPRAGRARLEILDPRGRRLWLSEADLAAGSHARRWDGRGEQGEPVGAGLYFVRLVTPWGTRVQRLAWLR